MNVLKIRAELRNGRSLFDLPLRVTFYARVSTEKDEQLSSLENQIQYYTELIRSKPSWTYIPGILTRESAGRAPEARQFSAHGPGREAGRLIYHHKGDLPLFSLHPRQHPIHSGAARIWRRCIVSK